jgi:hypothetical protein
MNRLWHKFWLRWHLFWEEYEKASKHWFALGQPKLKKR